MDYSLISLIINIAFIGTFVLSLLLGFLRGFKKSLNNLIANVIVIILAFSLCGVAAKIFVNMDVSFITQSDESMTLAESITNMLMDSFEVSEKDIPATIEFAESASIAIMRLPAYFMILMAGLSILKPLLKLLFKSIIPLGKGKTIGFRFIGLGVSFVSYVLLVFFFTAPIFGVTGLAKRVANNLTLNMKQEEVEEMSDSEFELDEALEELNNGIVMKIINGIFTEEYTLQAEFTGKLIEIKTQYGKINIKNEMDNHSTLVGIILEYSEDSDKMFNEIIDNQDAIIGGFENSEILNVFMPVAVEIIRLEAEDDDIDFDKLIEADWNEEKQNIVNILRALGEFADEVKIDFEKPETMLASPKLPRALKEIGQSLDNSGLFKDVMLVYINDLVHEALSSSEDGLEAIADVIDLTKLNLTKDFENIGYILNDLHTIHLFDEEEVDVINHIDSVDRMITKIFSLSTIKGNESAILKTILDNSDFSSMLDKMGIKLNYDNVDWDIEVNIFKAIIIDILNLIKSQGYSSIESVKIVEVLADGMNTGRTEPIVSKLASSQLIKDSLLNIIVTIMNEFELQQWKSEKLKAYENSNASQSEWAKEQILEVLKIYDELNKLMNIQFEKMSNSELAELKETLLKVNQLEIISLDPILPLINDALQSSGLNVSVLNRLSDYDYSSSYDANKDEWNNEIPRLIEIIKKVNNIYFNKYSILNETYNLAATLELMKESYVFGNDVRQDGIITTDDNIFNKLMIEVLSQNGMIKTYTNNGFIDYELALQDDWTRYNYNNELVVIRDFDATESVQSDAVISNLQSSEIAKRYFDIASILNDKMEYITYNYYGVTLKLSDYINDGNPFTNDDLYSRNWKNEIKDLNELINVFESSNSSLFISNLYPLTYASKTTYAADAAREIYDLFA